MAHRPMGRAMTRPITPACLRVLLAARMAEKTRRLLGARNGLAVPCLLWTGAQSRGGKRPSSGPYGSVWVPGVGGVRAHVVMAWIAGLIPDLRVPDGMHIDHLCERTLCVEETHFEVIPKLINIKRRWSRDNLMNSDTIHKPCASNAILRGCASMCEGSP